MKKIFVLLTISMISLTGIAQTTETALSKPAASNTNAGSKHHKDKHANKELMKSLNLSEDQKAKFKEMKDANKSKREAIKNNSALSDDEKKAQMKEMKTAQKQQMHGMLSADQRAKMKAFKQQRKMGRKHTQGNQPEKKGN